MGFFSKFYEKRLGSIIKKNRDQLPGHIVLILTESDLFEPLFSGRILDFIGWCREYSIRVLTVYISLIEVDAGITNNVYNGLMQQITSSIKDVDGSINLFSIKGERSVVRSSETSEMTINISVGYGGKKELTKTFRDIMSKIESGELEPGDIDESVIEQHLLFKHEPDLVIRSGGKRLADFLIWQSVYSEIYFTDVSWINLRKLDFLRAIRDFQKRQRRFGK